MLRAHSVNNTLFVDINSALIILTIRQIIQRMYPLNDTPTLLIYIQHWITMSVHYNLVFQYSRPFIADSIILIFHSRIQIQNTFDCCRKPSQCFSDLRHIPIDGVNSEKIVLYLDPMYESLVYLFSLEIVVHHSTMSLQN